MANRNRRIAFRVMACLIGVMPFVVLELGLRQFGVGKRTPYIDPLVGFSEVHPLFEESTDASCLRTARSRQLFFAEQAFTARKPANGFRVFCLGGSTVRGRPFHVETAFSQWLQLELTLRYPRHVFEVVNCGGLSYASYRLRLILDEVLHYQPDLIVLAMGHNEFLEDRTYHAQKSRSAAYAWLENRASKLRTVNLARQAWGNARDPDTILSAEVKAKLDEESGYASYRRDALWRAGVVQHFDASLRAMINMCREAHVPVVLVELGSNLRDTAPFKSQHTETLDAVLERQWQRAFDRGLQQEALSPGQALTSYRQAEAIDDQFALLAFHIARCLDRLGERNRAKDYYVLAKDQDICPLRMPSDMAGIVRRMAAETGTPLIDAAGVIARQSELAIPGYETYTDHVHPTIMGHQQIALELADEVVERQYVAATAVRVTQEARRTVAARHLQRLGLNYLTSGRERVGWLERWARRNRVGEDAVASDSRALLRRGIRRMGFNEFDAGWRDLEHAFALDTGLVESAWQWARKLFRHGHTEQARRLLARLEASPAADPWRTSIGLDLFLLTCESGDQPTARQLGAAYGSSFDELDAQFWSSLAPHALATAREIVSDE